MAVGERPSCRFGEHLGGRIPGPRRRLHVGGDRQGTGETLPPDDLAAARQHHAPDTGFSCRFQNVVDADDVVGQKLGHEIVVVGRGGQVNQGVAACRGSAHGRGVGEISDQRNIGAGPRCKIEAAHPMAAGLQLTHRRLADAAGRAGDKNGSDFGHRFHALRVNNESSTFPTKTM